jgi:hypothetical protein
MRLILTCVLVNGLSLMFFGNSLCLLLPAIALTCLPPEVFAQGNVWSSGGEHPVKLAANTDASTCSQCHTDVGNEKYVHRAMAMGCTTCHEIKNEKVVTHVNLVAPVTGPVALSCGLTQTSIIGRRAKSGDRIHVDAKEQRFD